MILILSNRTINLQAQGPDLFEACLNPIGAQDVVLATAELNASGDWLVNLVPTPPQGSWMTCNDSCELLARLVTRMHTGDDDDQEGGLRFDKDNKTYNWIFLIPGYSSSVSSALRLAHQLEKEYHANVMLISWPADPPGLTIPSQAAQSYRQAQAAARVAAIQLDKTLEELGTRFADPIRRGPQGKHFRFCLLIHSLGNYLFESYVRAPVYSGESRIFDTIVMHQPDVSSRDLSEWIHKVTYRDSLYLTINEFDGVLRLSDVINDVRAGLIGGQDRNRLVKFIDFTHGRNVQAEHFLFTGVDNTVIREACRRMIRGVPGGADFNIGLDGAGGFTLHTDSNLYVLNDPFWQEFTGD